MMAFSLLDEVPVAAGCQAPNHTENLKIIFSVNRSRHAADFQLRFDGLKHGMELGGCKCDFVGLTPIDSAGGKGN